VRAKELGRKERSGAGDGEISNATPPRGLGHAKPGPILLAPVGPTRGSIRCHSHTLVS